MSQAIEGFWAKVLNPGGRSWDPCVTPLVEGVSAETDDDSYGRVFVVIQLLNNGEVYPFLPGGSMLPYRNEGGSLRFASVGKPVRVVAPGDYDREATAEELLGWVNETM